MRSITEKITEKTICNEDGDILVIKSDHNDADHRIVVISTDGSDFWFEAKDYELIVDAISSMCEVGK